MAVFEVECVDFAEGKSNKTSATELGSIRTVSLNSSLINVKGYHLQEIMEFYYSQKMELGVLSKYPIKNGYNTTKYNQQ